MGQCTHLRVEYRLGLNVLESRGGEPYALYRADGRVCLDCRAAVGLEGRAARDMEDRGDPEGLARWWGHFLAKCPETIALVAGPGD